jgi:hypothetical protein
MLPPRFSGKGTIDSNLFSTSHGSSTAAHAMRACRAIHLSKMISPGFVKVRRLPLPTATRPNIQGVRKQTAQRQPQRRAFRIASGNLNRLAREHAFDASSEGVYVPTASRDKMYVCMRYRLTGNLAAVHPDIKA